MIGKNLNECGDESALTAVSVVMAARIRLAYGVSLQALCRVGDGFLSALSLIADRGAGTTDQEMGTYVPAVPGSLMTIHYKYNDSTLKYDQTVAINGTIVSRLSTGMLFFKD